MQNGRSQSRGLGVAALLVAIVVVVFVFSVDLSGEAVVSSLDQPEGSASEASERASTETAESADDGEPTAPPTHDAGAEVTPSAVPDPTAETSPETTLAPTSEPTRDTSPVVIDGGDWTITENDVERIRDFIEVTHELDFTGPVGVRISDDIGREYADGFEPFDRDEWELLRMLGLTEADADRDEANQLRRDRIRGFCCLPPGESGPLEVVMELQPSKFATELILMHELVHALHVQNPRLYPLGRYYSAETPLTFSAAVEGVPQYVVFRYLEMASEEQRASVVDDLPIIRDDMFSLLDDGPARHLNWAYDTGADFVVGVFAERGAQGLSDLIGEPPSTNEQVLYPDKYLAGEEAIPIERPLIPAGAEARSEGTIGAALLMWVLADQVGQPAALDMVAEWAGDSYVIYDLGQQQCLSAAVMVDDRADEIGSAMLAQLRVDFPEADGEAAGTTVAFDTCGNVG